MLTDVKGFKYSIHRCKHITDVYIIKVLTSSEHNKWETIGIYYSPIGFIHWPCSPIPSTDFAVEFIKDMKMIKVEMEGNRYTGINLNQLRRSH